MALTVTDWRRIARLKRAGVRYPVRIVREAKAAGVVLSWAVALVEQESGFRNVFGCDKGSILCHLPVTQARVQRLISHVRLGGVSNGVGLTQLTSLPLILEAERAGGAHRVTPQLRVGFRFFNSLTQAGKAMGFAWHYNGAQSYQAEIKAKQLKWHRVVIGV